jgi:outer membrane protein assembly factor BamB
MRRFRVRPGRLLGVLAAVALLVVLGRWVTLPRSPRTSTPPVHVVKPARRVPPHRYRGLVGSPTPFTGAIYIADEAGNRIIKVNVQKQILWTARVPAPDDVNPMPDGGPIIVNSDANQIVYAVSPKTGRILWTYGHLGHSGSQPGYLYIPEDSYGMPHNQVLITDPGNERAIRLNWQTGQILWQYGHTGVESVAPGYLYWTNNAVPLADGDVLITDGAAPGLPQQLLMVSPAGQLVWHIVLPPVITYPSDAMPVGPGLYALTDYANPAGLYVVNQAGQIVWSYRVTSGPGRLNHASSINRLPNGNFLVSDDQNNRVVVIDPATHQIVWQYGITGVSGSGPDELVGNTDAKAVGEPLPPFVPWEGYGGSSHS